MVPLTGTRAPPPPEPPPPPPPEPPPPPPFPPPPFLGEELHPIAIAQTRQAIVLMRRTLPCLFYRKTRGRINFYCHVNRLEIDAEKDQIRDSAAGGAH